MKIYYNNSGDLLGIYAQNSYVRFDKLRVPFTENDLYIELEGLNIPQHILVKYYKVESGELKIREEYNEEVNTLMNNLKKRLIQRVKIDCGEMLKRLDWKVLRHLEEERLVENNVIESTSLTAEEFKALLEEKESLRRKSDQIEEYINTTTSLNDLYKFENGINTMRVDIQSQLPTAYRSGGL